MTFAADIREKSHTQTITASHIRSQKQRRRKALLELTEKLGGEENMVVSIDGRALTEDETRIIELIDASFLKCDNEDYIKRAELNTYWLSDIAEKLDMDPETVEDVLLSLNSGRTIIIQDFGDCQIIRDGRMFAMMFGLKGGKTYVQFSRQSMLREAMKMALEALEDDTE